MNDVTDNGVVNLRVLDQKRVEYLEKLSSLTGRNVISYYSGWMYRPESEDTSINDKDMNAFMETVSGLDKKMGLDLILHTPGGDITATEHIINYLHAVFGGDIRAIIPHMAMSAGSMISVSCKQIIMGKQSCLGPFDPQLGGVACQSVINEFEKAKEDVKSHPESLGLWQCIISKYNPTFILACEQAVELANEVAGKILSRSVSDPKKIEKIKGIFNDNKESKTHSRHFSKEKAKDAGLNILDLEQNQELQDCVLSIHHASIITLENSNVAKMVENQNGRRYIRLINVRRE